MARELQNRRFRGTGISCNAKITPEFEYFKSTPVELRKLVQKKQTVVGEGYLSRSGYCSPSRKSRRRNGVVRTGYYGHPSKQCICGKKQAAQYLSKISGPLLDRFDPCHQRGILAYKSAYGMDVCSFY